MTFFTIVAIIAVSSYCAFGSAGRMLKADPSSMRSLGTCILVAVLSVLTALPIALIARCLDSTFNLSLVLAALIGLLAGEVTFFLRAPHAPPAGGSR